MSKARLQVLVDDAELGQLRKAADAEGLALSEWVRRQLRAGRDRQAAGDLERKLEAVRVAVRHSGPTANIDEVLDAIEPGDERSLSE